MFIGHFAAGLAAKKFAPQVNLGIFFFACQLLDLIWPALVLVGIESVHVDHSATLFTPLNFDHYPYSHSLIMSVVYSLAIGYIIYHFYKSKRAGVITGAVVLSHWILDYITHRPDLPIGLSGSKFGLGLWNSIAGTLLVEITLFIIGVYLCASTLSFRSKGQKIGFWSLIAFLLIAYTGNALGPWPPMDTPPIYIAGPALALWILVFWAYLVDRKASH